MEANELVARLETRLKVIAKIRQQARNQGVFLPLLMVTFNNGAYFWRGTVF